MDRQRLEQYGWTVAQNVASQSELLELASAIGRPKASPTGKLIRSLIPRLASESTVQTLSAKYGTGRFPLHTDTAFWPVPCRYLVFRAVGDIRRATTILSFARLLETFGTKFRGLAERSIWLARTPGRAFYCSMIFKVGQKSCWRYDSQCMFPVNNAASEVADILNLGMSGIGETDLEWSEGIAVVMDNWKVLHGRGPMPFGEQRRILERIYVE
jgi:hypothetical protein